MLGSMLKTIAATAAFAVVHSTLASSAVKQQAAGLVGERNRNGLYRVFFIAQSALTASLLAMYLRQLPSREIYRVEGLPAGLMQTFRGAALLAGFWAARQIGIARVSGVEALVAWSRNGAVPSEPVAQGPALDNRGLARTAGRFAWSRHPLNLVPLPVLWLSPVMTTTLLAFNIATTFYLAVGSLHEESRLRQAYGAAYEAYLKSGVPFYLPAFHRSAMQAISRLCEPRSDGSLTHKDGVRTTAMVSGSVQR